METIKNNIINMSMEIVKKVGNSVYREAFYECDDDEYIGKEYVFDKLKISYYITSRNTNKRLYVYIDDQQLLYYSFDTNYLEFIDGNWTNLISIIYKQIPRLLKEKQEQEEILNNKKLQLDSMKGSFKYYADSKNNQELRDTLNLQLSKYDISVSEKEYYNQILNRFDGKYENCFFPNHTYTVFYNNERVAEFDDDKYYIYPDILKFAEKFIPGEWTNNFDRAIKDTKDIVLNIIRKKADASANEMIKKLTKKDNN